MRVPTLTTLVRAVLDHEDQVPCTRRYASWWTDPATPAERTQARLLCRSCPALTLCTEVTEADPPRNVVQAGRWWPGVTQRDPRRGRG